MNEWVVHVAPRNVWNAQKTSGTYKPDTFEAEGFIHLSRLNQVLPVANTFFRGAPGLVLVAIDPERLRAELRYEAPIPPPGSGDLDPWFASQKFPHLYGPLNIDAVVGEYDFTPGPNGDFQMPAELQQ